MRNLIGFFDSGVGGISVLHEAVRLLPGEHFLFYGDNRNAPYGTRPEAEIVELCRRAVDRLLERDVKAIVLACNTATAAYAQTLRASVDIPVIGMEPAVKPAQLARRSGEVLALATRATLSLPKFAALMRRYGDNVIPVVGEGFVELVESGEFDGPRARTVVEDVLGAYLGRNIEGIVLGCTHYPFLAPLIAQLFPGAQLYDGRAGTVRQLKRRLQALQLLSKDVHGSIELTSSAGERAVSQMRMLLGAMDDVEVRMRSLGTGLR